MHSVLEMSEEDSVVCVNDKHKENYGKNIKWMLTCNAKLDKFKKYIVKIVNKSEMSRWDDLKNYTYCTNDINIFEII